MKIGILTFWESEDNYGQLLQCYASQKFFKKNGHETFLIRASNESNNNQSIKQKLKNKLRTAYRLRKYPIYLLKRVIKSVIYTVLHGKLRESIPNRKFEDFRMKYLNCTPVYSIDMLRSNPPQADAYVVGSDQVWNSTDGLYFLNWAPRSVKKISLAASFGARIPSPEFTNLISPWLQQFDLVTVRELSGKDICELSGIDNAIVVPDPTLMLRAEDYTEIMATDVANGDYLFIYFLGTRTNVNWTEIYKFARKNKLKIVYVGSQGQEDKYPKIEPTIEEWLALIDNAKYVITNSFHGTVFSILFSKKFMVMPVCGPSIRMNDRLETLLKPLDLSYRIYAGDLSLIERNIDYNVIFSKLDKSKKSAEKAIVASFE